MREGAEEEAITALPERRILLICASLRMLSKERRKDGRVAIKNENKENMKRLISVIRDVQWRKSLETSIPLFMRQRAKRPVVHRRPPKAEYS